MEAVNVKRVSNSHLYKQFIQLSMLGVRSQKLSNVCKLIRASEGTLSFWSRLHLQALAPTNLHWARMVGYGPISFCAIDGKSVSHQRTLMG
jgi:hypothetical protein